MITLGRWASDTSRTAHNTAMGAWSGSTFVFGSTAADWVLLRRYSVAPGQILTEAKIVLSAPSGAAATTCACNLVFRDASAAIITSITGPAVTITPTAWTDVPVTVGAGITVPAGAVAAELVITVTAGASGRQLTERNYVLTSIATAEDIISAALERDQRRDTATGAAGNLILTSAPIGPRSGQVVYLCSWAQFAALDALYRGGPVTLPAQSAVLPAIQHYATGLIRAATERGLPGRDTRWLVTVPIREVS